MAEGTEEISVYVEKFRLINEPTNHWEARKKFLMSNWGDYPEMQLVSLSMVWSNMQFDGCKYSPDLMDRVRDMAAGINTQASTTTQGNMFQVTPQAPSILTTPSCKIQENQPEEKPLENPGASQGLNSIDRVVGGIKTTTETEFQEVDKCLSAKNINGARINISKDTPLISIYPPQGNPKFDKLTKTCNDIKEKAMRGKTEKQIYQTISTLVSFHKSHKCRCEYQHVIEDKKNQSWKAFILIGETLCSTSVASAKIKAREMAIHLLIDLIKEHNPIALQESCMKERNELEFVYEMVFLNGKPSPQQKLVEAGQDCQDEGSLSVGSDIQTGSRKQISVESILESLPQQYANHPLNCRIIPAPRLPNFVLYECQENERPGVNNPVSKIINSCSMCKVPCEFISESCVIGEGNVGIVYSVFICHQSIATGLAIGNREAKHLAAHNAIRALKLTNTVLMKTANAESTSIERDELTDGPSKEEQLPETNVGHKMLKMMGWKGEGAGIGKKEDGIANPVKATGTSSRNKQGLGSDVLAMLNDPTTKKLDERKLYQFLQDFARSDRKDELVFTNDMKMEERKKIHSICQRLGLKSKSRGKGESRYLTVGRKWRNVSTLVQAVEEEGGSMGGYELIGPQFLAK